MGRMPWLAGQIINNTPRYCACAGRPKAQAMAEGICLLRFHTSCGAMLDMVVQLSREPAPWLPAARRLTTPTHRQIMATAAHFFILFCALKLKTLGPTYEQTGARLECVKNLGPAEQYHKRKNYHVNTIGTQKL